MLKGIQPKKLVRRSKDTLLGMTEKGRVLVLYGDEFPTEFVPWLQPIAQQYEYFLSLANSIGKQLPIRCLHNFLEAIGIDMEYRLVNTQFCTGRFVMGWIAKGSVRAVKSQAKALFKQIEDVLQPENPWDLMDRIATLEACNDDLLAKIEKANEQKQQMEKHTSRELERLKTLHLEREMNLIKLLQYEGRKVTEPVAVGPILLVDDWVIVASTYGQTELPKGFYRLYLDYVKATRPQALVEVDLDLEFGPHFGCSRRITHKLKDEDEWETVWHRYRFNIAPHYRIRVKGENRCQRLEEVASKLFKSDVTVIEDKKENE